MRAIAFVTRLLDNGKINAGDMKQMLIHSIRDDDAMTEHSVASKFSSDWKFLTGLHDSGATAARRWLKAHFDDLGKRSTVDLEAEFL